MAASGFGASGAFRRAPFAVMADCTESNSSTGKPRTPFLKASILNNPFKLSNSDKDDKDIFNPFVSKASSSLFGTKEETNSDEKNTSEEKKVDEIVPKFVPLQSSKESISFAGGNSIAPTPTGLSRAGGFVFGQNLKERVVISDRIEQSTSSEDVEEHPATNGTSNSLFSNAVQSADSFIATSAPSDSESLAKSAQTWEQIRDSTLPPIPPEQPVMTGEEGETNLIQMNCRLFAFEDGLWKERGRSQLRLNDGEASSRLVCRSAGSLRILLNTKIWSEMIVEKPGTRSLRITATDAQHQLKVFLIMASPDEISQLHKALSRRVAQAQKNKDNNEPNKPTAVSSSDLINSKSLDKIETKDDSKDDDSISLTDGESETTKSGNPVVIISNEDDDNAANREILKRSQSEDSGSASKKMCMAFPTDDDGTEL